MKPAKKLFQISMYPGKNNESISETRSHMYEKQKQKSSSNLIPDQSSLSRTSQESQPTNNDLEPIL